MWQGLVKPTFEFSLFLSLSLSLSLSLCLLCLIVCLSACLFLSPSPFPFPFFSRWTFYFSPSPGFLGSVFKTVRLNVFFFHSLSLSLIFSPAYWKHTQINDTKKNKKKQKHWCEQCCKVFLIKSTLLNSLSLPPPFFYPFIGNWELLNLKVKSGR